MQLFRPAGKYHDDSTVTRGVALPAQTGQDNILIILSKVHSYWSISLY